ncbi:glycoside hydrolase family 3 C-terminal domain-containing protein [Streptomyces sp. H39-S7]|uniref:glycoside hydrolase family 3 C-terminal domain-containing protein n=1 Tax=Streptomyces sp. H39-S7 TaxID=3004357 RepID=UPI0022AE7DC3|nr:glycoside hydrolase family 3 C-terminal domain-containing protein [Streptomyces sp. H39-S7]MCZ4124611.1 glycoside hydrolase family 3 C-terminal domain-containing protein [Streptomyces sp. H39-S7]
MSDLPTVAAAAPRGCPWVHSADPIPQRITWLLAAMTTAQKVQLSTGAGGSSYVGFTPAIGSLCIPAMNLHDGPAGVGNGATEVTQLPAPVSIASTWDLGAEQRYGSIIGAEQSAKGSTVDLGPTINIVRDPRWGRAFESMGEDPFLNGQLAAATIRGVQSTGMMAQVKHLAAYNQETNRGGNRAGINVDVSTKALQEIYLPAFRDAVRQGATSSVMCSYNKVQAVQACENPYLLTTALRRQFGFQGFVTSDWGAVQSTAPSANAGLDQDMSGKDGYYGKALEDAVASGQVGRSTLDAMTTRILTQMFAFGLFDRAPTGSPAQPATSAAHKSAAAQLAAEGTVLLKNSGNVLPLTSSTTSIAVIGTASDNARTSGGGSAHVQSSGTITPLQGIRARAGNATVTYHDGSDVKAAAAAAGTARVAVVFVSGDTGEGKDLSGIDLPGTQNGLVSAVAAANPNTVVVLNTGSAVAMPWAGSVRGIMEAWYPGQGYGAAIASLLFGDSNPSGHLPVTFPTSLSQVPAHTTAQWPGANGTVQYSEGVNVGYRHYDANHLTPLFPFGHGLSYTAFSFSNLRIGTLPKGGVLTVTATVTNIGGRAGADVAQLYVTQPAASGEPARQLQGFARVDLQPGAGTTVTFPLTERSLSHYSESAGGWVAGAGAYTIAVGDSAGNLPLTGTVDVTTAQLGRPLTVTNPGAQEGLAGRPVSVRITAYDSTGGQTPAFTATGLPGGTAITSGGQITGTPARPGTYTVDVTARDAAGAQDTATFLWTVVPADASAATPLIGVRGTCLDVAGADNTDRTKVDTYDCNGTNAQMWAASTGGTVRALGKCLDVTSAGTANGTRVQLFTCNGTAAQIWQRQPDGSLRNPRSTRCLDAPTESSANGTQVQIWTCWGGANQKWNVP